MLPFKNNFSTIIVSFSYYNAFYKKSENPAKIKKPRKILRGRKRYMYEDKLTQFVIKNFCCW